MRPRVVEVERNLVGQQLLAVIPLRILVHAKKPGLYPRIAQLSGASDAWGDREYLPIVIGVKVDEFLQLRPWAHKAHLTAKHVPQLRQLIKPGGAQESPDRGNPEVPGAGNGMAGNVNPHRPKLQHRESSSSHTDPVRTVDDRPGRIEKHRHGNEQRHRDKERREQNQSGEI